MTVDSYRPSTSPFEMPVAWYSLRCRLSRKLVLPDRNGATLATTFRGAVLGALHDTACDRPGGTSCAAACRRPDTCARPSLYKPRSRWQGRDHASPVFFRVHESATSGGTTELLGRVVLWGRRACAARGVVFAAFQTAGTRGLADQGEGRRVGFRPELTEDFSGALGDWIRAKYPCPGMTRATLEFLEPCETSAPDLTALVGNRAHDLVQWDLEDSGRSARIGRAGCDALADEARGHAAACLARLRVAGGSTLREERGRRVSADNGHSFPLGGFRGRCLLEGDLVPAVPWLALLALRGAGGHASFGLGDVALSIGPAVGPRA